MKNWITVASTAVLLGFAVSAVADNEYDHDRNKRQRVFRAQLVGFNEVPSVSTTAQGEFYAIVNEAGTALTFWLSYKGLTFDAAQAHIHFGQHHTNGGVSVWLCQSAAVPLPRAPADVAARVAVCPLRATTMPISATITAADIVGPAGQGIAGNTATTPGDFAELLAAIRAGAAYANVHSGVAGNTNVTPPIAAVGFPGGEIRGQIN
jgi:CHRD domain